MHLNFIGSEHLLLGLLAEGEGVAAQALTALGVGLTETRAKLIDFYLIDEEDDSPLVPTGSIPFTPRAKKVLELSLREALGLGHNYIGTEHLLLGLVRDGEGVAVKVLTEVIGDLSKIRTEVLNKLALTPYPRAREDKRPLIPVPNPVSPGWDLTRAVDGTEKQKAQIHELLKMGWEPFAVTQDASHATTYHFRRIHRPEKDHD